MPNESNHFNQLTFQRVFAKNDLKGFLSPDGKVNEAATNERSQDDSDFSFLTIDGESFIANSGPSGHISLKVPNVEFDFDVSVDSMQLLTHTLKT